jgi:hypothetical protein
MSQLTQEVTSQAAQVVTGPLSMLGLYRVQFFFGQSSTSTRTVRLPIQNIPPGVQATSISNESFDIYYTDSEQFGYGKLQVSLSAAGSEAVCTVTLRDNNTNKRKWEGSVTGMVTFYGK